MIIPFSERHKRLMLNKSFDISFSSKQKMKFFYHLEEYIETFDETTETNWNYTESSFDKVYRDMLRAYGLEELTSSSRNSNHEKIKNFTDKEKGVFILDVIELFFQYVSIDRKNQFVSELNQLLKVESISVRFMDGEFLRLDSEFLESEVLFQTTRLLSSNNFETAHNYFLDARTRLSSGDYSGSIVSANNSLESYLKKLLKLKNKNQGDLKKVLNKSGLIPNYFHGFLENFNGLVQSAFTIANKSARHGTMETPKEKNKIDEPIAAFCLHLIGTLILFIVDRHIKSQPEIDLKKEESTENNSYEEDLPF